MVGHMDVILTGIKYQGLRILEYAGGTSVSSDHKFFQGVKNIECTISIFPISLSFYPYSSLFSELLPRPTL